MSNENLENEFKEAYSKDFMNLILGDVYKKLTSGGNPKMLGENNFIAWEPVPTVLGKDEYDFAFKGFFGLPKKTKDMSDEDLEELRASKKYAKYKYAEEFARIADQIPANIPELKENAREFTIFSPDAENTVSKVYSHIMDFSVVKKTEINEKVEKKLEKLRKKLFKVKKIENPDFDEESAEDPVDNPRYLYPTIPSPMYMKYLEYEVQYTEALEELNNLQIAVDSGDIEAMATMAYKGDILKKKRDRALKRWETLGYKTKVEKIMNYIEEIESTDFITLKKRYESEFVSARRTGLGSANNYYYTSPLPAAVLQNSKDWIKYKFNYHSFESSIKKSSVSMGGGASYGFFIKINAKKEKEDISSQFNMKDLKMEFKIGKCFITRPWLSTTFIKSRYWKFSKTGQEVINNQMVSDGKGKGLMPAIVTELYFITDLDIGFKKGSSSYKLHKEMVKGGLSLNLGPLTIPFGGKARYKSSKESTESSGESTSQELTSDGILLIGRKCKILDMAPNPLPSITEDEWTEVN